ENCKYFGTQNGNSSVGNSHLIQSMPNLRSSNRKRNTLSREVPMEVDRKNGIHILEHVLSLVCQERLAVFSAATVQRLVAAGLEGAFSGPNVSLVHNEINIVEFPPRDISV